MPVAMTIVFALASSLLLSLTVMIPVLASFLLKKVRTTIPWLPRAGPRLYEPIWPSPAPAEAGLRDRRRHAGTAAAGVYPGGQDLHADHGRRRHHRRHREAAVGEPGADGGAGPARSIRR